MCTTMKQRVSVGKFVDLSAPMIIIASRWQERPNEIIITANIRSLALSAESLALTIKL